MNLLYIILKTPITGAINSNLDLQGCVLTSNKII